jgi:hypothetical protein
LAEDIAVASLASRRFEAMSFKALLSLSILIKARSGFRQRVRPVV